MRKIFISLAAICLVASLFLTFGVIGYKFSAKLLLLPFFYFSFMAYSTGRSEKALSILRKLASALAIFGVLFTLVLCGIVLSDIKGDADAPCDYVIVLGAGLWKDKPSQTLADRLEKARDYLEEYPSSIAIVSGSRGDDETITEARAMKNYLTAQGIPGSRIIEEDRANNTNENMEFSIELINERGGGSIAVISSDYHIFRSRKLAESENFSPVMLSAKTTSPALFLNCLLREAFALVKAYLIFI